MTELTADQKSIVEELKFLRQQSGSLILTDLQMCPVLVGYVAGGRAHTAQTLLRRHFEIGSRAISNNLKSHREWRMACQVLLDEGLNVADKLASVGESNFLDARNVRTYADRGFARLAVAFTSGCLEDLAEVSCRVRVLLVEEDHEFEVRIIAYLEGTSERGWPVLATLNDKPINLRWSWSSHEKSIWWDYPEPGVKISSKFSFKLHEGAAVLIVWPAGAMQTMTAVQTLLKSTDMSVTTMGVGMQVAIQIHRSDGSLDWEREVTKAMP